MNENIDLTKILKDCPNGMKLYSPIFGEVYFKEIHSDNEYAIITTVNSDFNPINPTFTKEGFYYDDIGEECLLFPSKDQRDWSKFTAPWYKNEQKSADKIEPRFKVGDWVVNKFGDSWYIDSLDNKNYQVSDGKGNYNYFPISKQDEMHLWTIQDAKDGDVLAVSWLKDKNLWEKIIIFKKYHSEGVKGLYSMPCIEGYGNTFKNGEFAFTDEKEPYYSKTWTCHLHPATREQRDLLFQKIKEAGYKWNVKTKILDKLIKPKFNPKTLKPFDKVIVRDDKYQAWFCTLFSHKGEDCGYPYDTASGSYFCCIPYNDETKHLVGTKEEAPEYYRYWDD